MELKQLKGLLHEIANVLALALRVVDPIVDVQVHVLEQVEDRKDLAVVRHERLADHLTGHHQLLQQDRLLLKLMTLILDLQIAQNLH